MELREVKLKNFLVLLEYLYSDHAHVEEGYPVDMMAIANQYLQSRLLSLCELKIVKQVEAAWSKDTDDESDVDVIGLLLKAQVLDCI